MLGGYAIYFGSATNISLKTTNLKNDSLYYAAAYVLKGTEWSAGVTTTFTPTYTQLVHYWHFNNFNSNITAAKKPAIFTPYRADYSTIDTGKAHVAFQRLPNTSNNYATYWDNVSPGGTLNLQTIPGQGLATSGLGLRLRNPSDSMQLLVYAPTQGYKNVKFSYEATNSSQGSGVPFVKYAYSTDSGLTWKPVADTWVTPRPTYAGIDSIYFTNYTLHAIDFSKDTTVGHNPKFVIRILTYVRTKTGTAGSNSGTSGNLRADNFAITATPLSGSIGISTYQTAKVCVTNTVSGLDTIGFYYNPAIYFTGLKFTVQLSDKNGSFVTPTTIATVACDGSGSQKVVATIPAGTKNSSNYEIRVISAIADALPYGINNISYSPGDVASLNACGGNQTATIQWGAPTGCYNDSVLIVVSTKTITAVPTGTGSALKPSSIFGSGTSFGGGSVVYRGNGNKGTIFVSNLKNDSTYYVHVFTGYQSVWGAGLEVTVNPTFKHTTLCPGDIVSLGMSNQTSKDTLFFAPLVDLDSAATFFITNRSYNGSGLSPKRGTIKVTVNSFIPAGTVINVIPPPSGCAPVYIGNMLMDGWQCARSIYGNYLSLSNTGDYNLIFTGDTGVGQQNYISALSELTYSPGNTATNGSGDHTTGLPYGLSVGTTAFTMNQSASGTATNQIYSGSYIGDKATILNNMGKGSGMGSNPGADWTTGTTASIYKTKNAKLAVRPDGNVSNFTVDTTQYVYYTLNLNWTNDSGNVKATHYLIAMDSVSLNNITMPSDSDIFIHNPKYVLKTRTKSNQTNERYTWSGLTGGKKYYFKIFPVNMGTAYNGNPVSAYSLYTPVADSGIPTISPVKPTASMSSSTPLTNCAATTFTLPVNFTGTSPWILTYNDGNKDTTITTSSNPYNIVKYTTATTLYTLKSVYNYNGHNHGTIGTATRSTDILSNASRSITPANSSICSGGSQQFTMSNYNAATTVSWYYNTNPTATSSSWTSFGGNYDTATLSGITSNVYVHAIVTATGCAAVSSNDAYVKVDSASKLTVGAIGSTTVALSWTAVVGASSYTVHYGSSSTSVSGTSTTLTGLSACTAYSIYVSPNSSACSVGNSNTVSITTSPAAIALRLDTTGNLIKAHWNGVKGNRYKLYVSQLISLPNASVFTITKDTTYTIDLSKATGYKGQTLLMYVVLDSGSNCSSKPVSNTRYVNAKGGTCTSASPISLAVSTSSNSISLSWTGSSSYYNVYYKTVSGTSWKTYNTGSTNYTLTGLSTNTCYMVFVTNTCSISPFTVGYSTQIDTVCTPKPCATPNNLLLSNPTCHGFTATWNTVSGVSNYSLYYTRTSGVGAPVSFSYRSSTNSYTITSLSPGTSYSLYVRANCSTGAQSLSSNTESTTTKSIGCKDDVNGNSVVSTSSFNVYPNPNNGMFVINMNTTATAQTAIVEVMNVLGQLVYSTEVSNNNGQIIESINLNNKAAGLYIVRVRCGNDVQDAKVQVTR